MKKYIFVAIIISFGLVISFKNLDISTVTGETHAKKNITLADIENLENSIIIDGLDMTSGDKPSDELSGEIIFDDSFDDTGLQDVNNSFLKTNKKKSPVKPTTSKKASLKKSSYEKPDVKKKVSQVITIDSLKKKDKRWHLSEHVIKKGENLWKIAKQYETNHRYIIIINNIDEPKKLLPGKILQVPNRQGIEYNIKKGDTVYDIASRYNIKKEKLLSHNNIKNGTIYYGNELFIPGAKQPATKPENDHPVIKQNQNKETVNNRVMAFSWPVKGRITSSFGKRTDPFTKKKKFHCGIDISCNEGTPIKASYDGRVIYSDWKDGYGKVVIIKHEKGYITVYAHNRENIVNVNDEVKKGTVIAYSGMTGAVTGAHLHYEIRKYLTPLNPMKFLK